MMCWVFSSLETFPDTNDILVGLATPGQIQDNFNADHNVYHSSVSESRKLSYFTQKGPPHPAKDMISKAFMIDELDLKKRLRQFHETRL